PPSSLSHIRPPPTSSLFPCTTLFRSPHRRRYRQGGGCSSVVSDSRTCHETLRRFLKARIPFISIRTAERDRALDILRSIAQELTDRKSTRLNSSHVKISYAVFCLKKK